MPHLIVIADSNGSGQTTVAPALLKDSLHVNDFVNADVIAQGLYANDK
jgi:predicted ABC-type ATPase